MLYLIEVIKKDVDFFGYMCEYFAKKGLCMYKLFDKNYKKNLN